jgi:hypothetical protein
MTPAANEQLSLLADALKELGLPAEIQADSQQVFILHKADDIEFPVFARFVGSGQFVQLIAFLPGTLTEETSDDSARLLHMINREIDMPGFGMDEENQVAFYRLIMPAKQSQIDMELLEVYCKTVGEVLKTFANLAFAVIQGRLSLEEVKERAKDAESGAE